MYKTIMIIDDSGLDMYMTNQIIQKYEFAKEVIMFSDAYKAIAYLRSTAAKPSIIFCDIQMPLMSGFAFLRAYETLNEEVKEQCRIYVFSSCYDDNDLNKVNSDRNVAGFIAKPLTAEDLRTIQSREFVVQDQGITARNPSTRPRL
jgi:response regulator RpfG family c-di-GMP phosphodiesterase